jgi:hypothetical protein
MMRFTQFSPLVLATLLLASGAAPAKERPHSFRGSGQLTGFDFVSNGIATHLGAFSEEGSITSAIPTGEPGEFLITAWAIHTAADGDELHEVVTGRLNFLTGAASGTVTYVGGTGRFAYATGTATLQLQLAPDGSGKFDYSGKGTIDF